MPLGEKNLAYRESLRFILKEMFGLCNINFGMFLLLNLSRGIKIPEEKILPISL